MLRKQELLSIIKSHAQYPQESIVKSALTSARKHSLPVKVQCHQKQWHRIARETELWVLRRSLSDGVEANHRSAEASEAAEATEAAA